jgi:hypothetical protein
MSSSLINNDLDSITNKLEMSSLEDKVTTLISTPIISAESISTESISTESISTESISTESISTPTIINPSKMLVDIITIQKIKEEKANIWDNSIYKDLPPLQANNVGNVGEMLIQKICEELKINSKIDGTKTKQIGGGKEGDGKIKSKSVEVKTAHLGSSSPSFQHELGETPWNTDYIIFIDISPTDVYITIFKNFTEEEYVKKIKCDPYFPTKSISRRKGGGNFKLDTSIKINENCVKNGYSIKIKDNNINEIGLFINKMIM